MTVRDIERKYTNDGFIVVDNLTGDVLFNSESSSYKDFKAVRDLEVSGMAIDGNKLILGVWR